MSDRFVTVESYQFLPEAEAIRMHLEAEGIDAFLADAETVSTEWSLGNAVGYIKLQVPQFELDRARQLLGELRQRRHERDLAPESDGIARCLACDASLSPNQSKCQQCGWSYADPDETPGEWETDPRSADSAGSDGSLLDNLRAIKKPVMMIYLGPLLLIIAMSVILVLGWFLQLVTGL